MAEPLLTFEGRVHLLALLARRGRNVQLLAPRLAALRETPVASLQVGWRAGEVTTEPVPRDHILRPRRDRRGRVTGGELIWSVEAAPDPLELGRVLAEHLDIADDDLEIAWFLQDPGGFATRQGISEDELDDARRQLRSRRGASRILSGTDTERQAIFDVELVSSLDPASWSKPEVAEERSSAPPEPAKREYVDPSRASFGAARPVAGRPRPSLGGATGGRSFGTAGQTGSGLTGRSAPAPPEAGVAVFVASSKESEQRAVEIVIRLARGLPEVARVIDVQTLNKGWDLEFVMRDRRTVPVEVKGTTGSGGFVITANELAAIRTEPDYVLYQVIELADPGRAAVRVFRGLGGSLTRDLLTEAGWAVTGWQSIEHEVISLAFAGEE